MTLHLQLPMAARSATSTEGRTANKGANIMMKEIPLKQWIAEEAQRKSLSEDAIHQRKQRGLYPDLKLRRVNKRVIFVTVESRRLL